MAIKRFIGTQRAIAQVSTILLGVFDVTTEYILTVGEGNLTTKVSVFGITDIDTTAAALVTAWEATGAHPWVKVVKATSATATVTLTANVPGCPYTVVSSKAGGTGTIGAVVTATANQSGSDVNDAKNYDTGTLPASSDRFIHARGAPAIAWNLEALAALVNVEFIHPRGAGNVGLASMAFAISADGQQFDVNAPEYRKHYFKMGCATVEIGQAAGPSTIPAATRIKLNSPETTTLTAFSIDGISIDPGLPTMRFLSNSGTTLIDVVSANGGFGVGADVLEETATVGFVNVNDPTGQSRIVIGKGVLIALEYIQSGGVAVINTSAALPEMNVFGGTVEWVSTFSLTLIKLRGGTFLFNGLGGIVNCEHDGGILDASHNNFSRVITNYKPQPGAILKGLPQLAITNHFLPVDQAYQLAYT